MSNETKDREQMPSLATTTTPEPALVAEKNEPTPETSASSSTQVPPQDEDIERDIESPRTQELGLDEPLPPLHTPHRRRRIMMWIGIIILTLDLCYLPITYYYALKFGTSLTVQEIFAVITAVYGMISFAHYFFRSLKLFRSKTASKYRPVGWTKWGVFEFLHINFIGAISIVELELIVGTIPNKPFVRLCAMASPTICYWFGILFVGSAILTQMGAKLPFNMSSTPKGSTWRPALLALIEDAGGVEASGGVIYRANVMKRYEVSPVFRRMILYLTWAWGVVLLCVAITSTVLIASLSEDTGFGLGWGLPYVVSTVAVFLTMAFVKSQLRREKALWHTKREAAGQNNEV